MAVDRSLPILIVDDYKTMLRIIRNLLQQLEFTNVDEATDGATALQQLREKPYGLVISDWNMAADDRPRAAARGAGRAALCPRPSSW